MTSDTKNTAISNSDVELAGSAVLTRSLTSKVDLPALWCGTTEQLQRCAPFLLELRTCIAAALKATSSSWTEQNEALVHLLDCVQQYQDLIALTTSVTVYLNASSEVSGAPHSNAAKNATTAPLTLGDVVLGPSSGTGEERSAARKALPAWQAKLPLHSFTFPFTEFCATLWLGFDPRYPIGVQRRALEVLELVASHIVGEDGWRRARESMLQQRDFGFEEEDVSCERALMNETFPLLLMGVLQLLPQCSMQIKSSLLDYVETVLIFLSPAAVMQGIEGILVAVLPLLEEAEGSELHRRGLRVLACVRRKASSGERGLQVGAAAVYAVLWRLLVEAPALSGGVWCALTYLAQQDHILLSTEEKEATRADSSDDGHRETVVVDPASCTPLFVLNHLPLCGGNRRLVFWALFYTFLSGYTNGRGGGSSYAGQNHSRTMKQCLDFVLQYVPLHTLLAPQKAPPRKEPTPAPMTLVDTPLVAEEPRGLSTFSFVPPATESPGYAVAGEGAETQSLEKIVCATSSSLWREEEEDRVRASDRMLSPSPFRPSGSGNFQLDQSQLDGGERPGVEEEANKEIGTLFDVDEVALLVAAAIQLIAAPTTLPNLTRRLLQWIQTASLERGKCGAREAPPHHQTDFQAEEEEVHDDPQQESGAGVSSPVASFPTPPLLFFGASRSTRAASYCELLAMNSAAGAYLVGRAFFLMTRWWTAEHVCKNNNNIHSDGERKNTSNAFAAFCRGIDTAPQQDSSSTSICYTNNNKMSLQYGWELLQESAFHVMSEISGLTAAAAGNNSNTLPAGTATLSVHHTSFLPSHTASTPSAGTPSLVNGVAPSRRGGGATSRASVMGGKTAASSHLLVDTPPVVAWSSVGCAAGAMGHLVALPHLWCLALNMMTQSCDVTSLSSQTDGTALHSSSFPGAAHRTAATTFSEDEDEEMGLPHLLPFSPLGPAGGELSAFILKHWARLLGGPFCILFSVMRELKFAPSPTTALLEEAEYALLRRLGWRWLCNLQSDVLQALSTLSRGLGAGKELGCDEACTLMLVLEHSSYLWEKMYVPSVLQGLQGDFFTACPVSHSEKVMSVSTPVEDRKISTIVVSLLDDSHSVQTESEEDLSEPFVATKSVVATMQRVKELLVTRLNILKRLLDLFGVSLLPLLPHRKSKGEGDHYAHQNTTTENDLDSAAQHSEMPRKVLLLLLRHAEADVLPVASALHHYRERTHTMREGEMEADEDGRVQELLRVIIEQISELWRCVALPQKGETVCWDLVPSVTQLATQLLSLIPFSEGSLAFSARGGKKETAAEVGAGVVLYNGLMRLIRDVCRRLRSGGATATRRPSDRTGAGPAPLCIHSTRQLTLCVRLLFAVAECLDTERAKSSRADDEEDAEHWLLIAREAYPLLWNQLLKASNGGISSGEFVKQGEGAVSAEASEKDDILSVMIDGAQRSEVILATLNTLIQEACSSGKGPGSQSSFLSEDSGEERWWSRRDNIFRIAEYVLARAHILKKNSSEDAHAGSCTAIEEIARAGFFAYEQSLHFFYAQVHSVREEAGYLLHHTVAGGSAAAPLLHLLRQRPQEFLLPLYCALTAYVYTSSRQKDGDNDSQPSSPDTTPPQLQWNMWAEQPLLRCCADIHVGEDPHAISSSPSFSCCVERAAVTSLTTLLRFIAHLIEALAGDGNIPCSLDEGWLEEWERVLEREGNALLLKPTCWCRETLPVSLCARADGTVLPYSDWMEQEEEVEVEGPRPSSAPTVLVALSHLLLAVASSTLDRVEQEGHASPCSEYLQELHWVVRGLSSLRKCFQAHCMTELDTVLHRRGLAVPGLALLRRAAAISGLHHIYLPVTQWVLQCLQQDIHYRLPGEDEDGSLEAIDDNGAQLAAEVLGELASIVRDGVRCCLQVFLKHHSNDGSLYGGSDTRGSLDSATNLGTAALLRESSVTEVAYQLHVWRQCTMQLLRYEGGQRSLAFDSSRWNEFLDETDVARNANDHASSVGGENEAPPLVLTKALLEIWTNSLGRLWSNTDLIFSDASSGSKRSTMMQRNGVSAVVKECTDGLADVLHFVLKQSSRGGTETEKARIAPAPESKQRGSTGGGAAVPYILSSVGNQASNGHISRSSLAITAGGAGLSWLRSSKAKPRASIKGPNTPTMPLPTPLQAIERDLCRITHFLFSLALTPVNPSEEMQYSAENLTDSQQTARGLLTHFTQWYTEEDIVFLFLQWWLGDPSAAGAAGESAKSKGEERLKISALLLTSFLETGEGMIESASTASPHQNREGGRDVAADVTARDGPLERLLLELPQSSRLRRHVVRLLHAVLPSFRSHAEEEVAAFLQCTGYRLHHLIQICKRALLMGAAPTSPPVAPSPSHSGSPKGTPLSRSSLMPSGSGTYYQSGRSALSFLHSVLPAMLTPPTVEGVQPHHSDPSKEAGEPSLAGEEAATTDIETTPITYFISSVVYGVSPASGQGALLHFLIVLSVLRHRYTVSLPLWRALDDEEAAVLSRCIPPPSNTRGDGGESMREPLNAFQNAERVQRELQGVLLSDSEVQQVLDLVLEVLKKDHTQGAEWTIRVVLELLHLVLELLPRDWEKEMASLKSGEREANKPAATINQTEVAKGNTKATSSPPPPSASSSTPFSALHFTTTAALKALEQHLPSIVLSILQRVSKAHAFSSRDYRPEAHSMHALCLHFPVLFMAVQSAATTNAAGSSPKMLKKVCETVVHFFSQTLLPTLKFSTDNSQRSSGPSSGAALPAGGQSNHSSSFFFAPTSGSSSAGGSGGPPSSHHHLFSTMLSTPFSFCVLTCARMLFELPDTSLQQSLYEQLLSKASQPNFFDLSPLLLRQLSLLWHSASRAPGFRDAMNARNASPGVSSGGAGGTLSGMTSLFSGDARQAARAKAEFLKLMSFHTLSADQRSLGSREVLNSLLTLLSARLQEYSTVTTLKVMSSSDGQRMIEIPESSRWNLLSKPSEQFKTVALPSLTDVWSAAFLLCRCLLCRLDEVSLSYFWPVMLPELMHVVRLPCGEGIGGEEVQEAVRIVKLEAIKTIDMALTVCPASFSVFRWVFLENRIWVPADVSAYSLFAQSWSSKTSPSLPRTGSRFMLGEEAVGSCGLLRRPKQNRQNESSLLDEKENLRMRASSSMLYFELKEEERYRRFVESRAASQLRSSLLRRPWLYVLPSQRKWMESWEGIRFATHLLLRCHPYPALCSGPLEGEEIGPDCRGAALRDTLTGLIDDCIARSAPSGWSWDVEDVRNVLLLDISHKRK